MARRSQSLATALLLAAPSARAGSGEISFCNEFPHKLYIAIAYLQTDVNNYLSRGWLEVETGKCYVFDTAIRVESFYFRAESETYRDGKHKVKMEWGTDKKFAVRDANFQSYNAEKAYSGMRLAGFAKGAEFERRAAHRHRHLHRDGRIDHHHTGAREERGRGRRGGTTACRATGDAEQHRLEGGIEDKGPNPSDATLAPAGGGDSGGNGRDSGPRQ